MPPDRNADPNRCPVPRSIETHAAAGSSLLVAAALVYGVLLVAAAASHRYIELPGRRFVRSLEGKARVRSIPLGA